MHRKRSVIALACAAAGLWLVGFAAAQQNDQAHHKHGKLSAKDFVLKAQQINLEEIAAGKAAMSSANNTVAKEYGQVLMHDHELLERHLQQVAQGMNITLPTELDKKHQEKVNALSKLQGADFERHFFTAMIKGHEKAIKLFESEAKEAQNPQVRAYAEQALPHLRKHLQMARTAEKEVGTTQSQSR